MTGIIQGVTSPRLRSLARHLVGFFWHLFGKRSPSMREIIPDIIVSHNTVTFMSVIGIPTDH